jgi:hypothetical protein
VVEVLAPSIENELALAKLGEGFVSEAGTGGVKLPIVIAIAAGSVVLGMIGALAGFTFISNNGSASNSGDDSPTPSSEIAETEAEVSDTQGDSNSSNSIQDKMDAYVQWDVNSYVVDAARECTYRAGYLDMQINVTNLSEAAIIAGEAYVVIEDLFGNQLMLLTTPIDIQIASGETATIGSTGGTCWDLGNYGDELRLKEMADPYSATKVVFYLETLALESGEIVSF